MAKLRESIKIDPLEWLDICTWAKQQGWTVTDLCVALNIPLNALNKATHGKDYDVAPKLGVGHKLKLTPTASRRELKKHVISRYSNKDSCRIIGITDPEFYKFRKIVSSEKTYTQPTKRPTVTRIVHVPAKSMSTVAEALEILKNAGLDTETITTSLKQQLLTRQKEFVEKTIRGLEMVKLQGPEAIRETLEQSLKECQELCQSFAHLNEK